MQKHLPATEFSEYWLSQQRQSYWCLISLTIIIVIGLAGLYPDKFEFGRSTLYLRDMSHFWTHWIFPFFFFLVSMEARREVQSKTGELHGKHAIAPLIMALGGMIAPWLVFCLVTGTGEPLSGSFIPMATDIAFVVLAMTLGNASIKLRAALLTLAIADDIGGIILMALFFNVWGLAQIATVVLMGIAVFICQKFEASVDRLWVSRQAFFWVIICLGWIWLLNKVHIHPSLGGVITALMVPYRPGALRLEQTGRLRFSVYHVLEQSGLNVPVNWLIVPGFIMLSVVIKPDTLHGSWFTAESMGVFLGFVVGKTVGVFAGGLLALRILKELPANSMAELFYGSVICGMGLTVALFFAGLSSGINQTAATIAILGASAICGVVGTTGMYLVNRRKHSSSTA